MHTTHRDAHRCTQMQILAHSSVRKNFFSIFQQGTRKRSGRLTIFDICRYQFLYQAFRSFGTQLQISFWYMSPIVSACRSYGADRYDSCHGYAPVSFHPRQITMTQVADFRCRLQGEMPPKYLLLKTGDLSHSDSE